MRGRFVLSRDPSHGVGGDRWTDKGVPIKFLLLTGKSDHSWSVLREVEGSEAPPSSVVTRALRTFLQRVEEHLGPETTATLQVRKRYVNPVGLKRKL